MSLKHAILGFLSYQSLSGYDLKKAFDTSIQHFWPADQSQIYRTLRQLEQDTLVTKELVTREEHLDIKRYHITPSGQQALFDWLKTSLPESTTRNPFLIQIFFSGKQEDEAAMALIEFEIQRAQQRLVIYEEIYRNYADRFAQLENQREVFYTLLTLEYGLEGDRLLLQWLEDVLHRIKTKTYQPKAY